MMHNSEGQLSRWWRNLEETLDKQNFLSPHFAAAAWDEEWKNTWKLRGTLLTSKTGRKNKKLDWLDLD